MTHPHVNPAHVARSAGLDPRRARMVRESRAFGIEWRLAFEAARLLGAMALGAILTLTLAGHDSTSAGARAGAAATEVPTVPTQIAEPELLAPLAPVARAEPAESTAQSDVYSDGGGHCSINAPCGK